MKEREIRAAEEAVEKLVIAFGITEKEAVEIIRTGLLFGLNKLIPHVDVDNCEIVEELQATYDCL